MYFTNAWRWWDYYRWSSLGNTACGACFPFFPLKSPPDLISPFSLSSPLFPHFSSGTLAFCDSCGFCFHNGSHNFLCAENNWFVSFFPCISLRFGLQLMGFLPFDWPPGRMDVLDWWDLLVNLWWNICQNFWVFWWFTLLYKALSRDFQASLKKLIHFRV